MGSIKLPVTQEGGGSIVVIQSGRLDVKGEPGKVVVIRKG